MLSKQIRNVGKNDAFKHNPKPLVAGDRSIEAFIQMIC